MRHTAVEKITSLINSDRILVMICVRKDVKIRLLNPFGFAILRIVGKMEWNFFQVH